MPQITKNSGIWLNGWSKLDVARKQITSEHDAELSKLEAELGSFKLKTVKNNNYYYKYTGGGKWKYVGCEKNDPTRFIREQVEKVRLKRARTLAKFEETVIHVDDHAVIDLSVFKPLESELLRLESLLRIIRGNEPDSHEEWGDGDFKE